MSGTPEHQQTSASTKSLSKKSSKSSEKEKAKIDTNLESETEHVKPTIGKVLIQITASDDPVEIAATVEQFLVENNVSQSGHHLILSALKTKVQRINAKKAEIEFEETKKIFEESKRKFEESKRKLQETKKSTKRILPTFYTETSLSEEHSKQSQPPKTPSEETANTSAECTTLKKLLESETLKNLIESEIQKNLAEREAWKKWAESETKKTLRDFGITKRKILEEKATASRKSSKKINDSETLVEALTALSETSTTPLEIEETYIPVQSTTPKAMMETERKQRLPESEMQQPATDETRNTLEHNVTKNELREKENTQRMHVVESDRMQNITDNDSDMDMENDDDKQLKNQQQQPPPPPPPPDQPSSTEHSTAQTWPAAYPWMFFLPNSNWYGQNVVFPTQNAWSQDQQNQYNAPSMNEQSILQTPYHFQYQPLDLVDKNETDNSTDNIPETNAPMETELNFDRRADSSSSVDAWNKSARQLSLPLQLQNPWQKYDKKQMTHGLQNEPINVDEQQPASHNDVQCYSHQEQCQPELQIQAETFLVQQESQYRLGNKQPNNSHPQQWQSELQVKPQMYSPVRQWRPQMQNEPQQYSSKKQWQTPSRNQPPKHNYQEQWQSGSTNRPKTYQAHNIHESQLQKRLATFSGKKYSQPRLERPGLHEHQNINQWQPAENEAPLYPDEDQWHVNQNEDLPNYDVENENSLNDENQWQAMENEDRPQYLDEKQWHHEAHKYDAPKYPEESQWQLVENKGNNKQRKQAKETEALPVLEHQDTNQRQTNRSLRKGLLETPSLNQLEPEKESLYEDKSQWQFTENESSIEYAKEKVWEPVESSLLENSEKEPWQCELEENLQQYSVKHQWQLTENEYALDYPAEATWKTEEELQCELEKCGFMEFSNEKPCELAEQENSPECREESDWRAELERLDLLQYLDPKQRELLEKRVEWEPIESKVVNNNADEQTNQISLERGELLDEQNEEQCITEMVNKHLMEHTDDEINQLVLEKAVYPEHSDESKCKQTLENKDIMEHTDEEHSQQGLDHPELEQCQHKLEQEAILEHPEKSQHGPNEGSLKLQNEERCPTVSEKGDILEHPEKRQCQHGSNNEAILKIQNEESCPTVSEKAEEERQQGRKDGGITEHSDEDHYNEVFTKDENMECSDEKDHQPIIERQDITDHPDEEQCLGLEMEDFEENIEQEQSSAANGDGPPSLLSPLVGQPSNTPSFGSRVPLNRVFRPRPLVRIPHHGPFPMRPNFGRGRWPQPWPYMPRPRAPPPYGQMRHPAWRPFPPPPRWQRFPGRRPTRSRGRSFVK